MTDAKQSNEENEKQKMQMKKMTRRKFMATLAMAGVAVTAGSLMNNPSSVSEATNTLSEASVFNVKDYGATGTANPGDNDTLAIQSAIDAAASVAGGIIYFPPGSYICGPIVVASNNIIMRGSGSSSTIYFTSSTGTWLTFQDCAFSGLEYLNFENANLPTSGSVVSIDNCAWIHLNYVKMGFYTNLFNGISITSIRGGAQAIYINNCYIFKYNGAAISADTSLAGSQTINDIFVENCFIQWLKTNPGDLSPNTSIGIKLIAIHAAVQAINITNCEISASYWTFYGLGARFLHVMNTYFDGYNFFDTINISTFHNTWFSGSSGPNVATNAMDIRNCIGIQFINCHIDPESVLNSASANMIIQGACNHILIDGCMLGGAGYYGIVVGSGDNVIISKCYFGKNNAFLNQENMNTAISVQSTFTGYLNLSDNDMRDISTKVSNSAITGKIYAKGNIGYNPVGNLPAPTITGSGNEYMNTYPVTVRVSVAGGSGIGIYINSTPTGLSEGSFIIEPGESIALTYINPPTSWIWQGL